LFKRRGIPHPDIRRAVRGLLEARFQAGLLSFWNISREDCARRSKRETRMCDGGHLSSFDEHDSRFGCTKGDRRFLFWAIAAGNASAPARRGEAFMTNCIANLVVAALKESMQARDAPRCGMRCEGESASLRKKGRQGQEFHDHGHPPPDGALREASALPLTIAAQCSCHEVLEANRARALCTCHVAEARGIAGLDCPKPRCPVDEHVELARAPL
jgi:hypothetical protein